MGPAVGATEGTGVGSTVGDEEGRRVRTYQKLQKMIVVGKRQRDKEKQVTGLKLD